MNKRVLFVSNKNFKGKNNFGGAQCANRNYELVLSAFEKVNFLILSDEELDLSDVSSDDMFVKLSSNNVIKYYNMLFCRDCYSKKAEKKIQKYIDKIDPNIVFFDGSSFGKLGKLFSKNTKKIVFYHNIEKCYAKSRIWNTSVLCVVKFFSFWINEAYITKNADVCICLNERDNKLLNKHYGRNADFFLPITFSDVGKTKITKKSEENIGLLFVGSNFMPNVKGITWFCKNVMPYVNKKLIIVGKNMELLKTDLESDNIQVVGSVLDLSEYYNKAEAVVMPIFIGDGMKVKTAEAMMYGKPIIATNEALEGYEVENVDGIYRCNSAGEFIDVIRSGIKNSYEQKIRDLFCDKYSSEVIKQQTIEFLRNI